MPGRRTARSAVRLSDEQNTRGAGARPAERAPVRAAPTLRTCGVMPAEGAMQTRIQAPREASATQVGIAAVRLQQVTKSFAPTRRGAEPVVALDAVSLHVAPGEI